ncbi:MAG: CBS domain-containing protein [candidate division NC10 bacterium]|nr:CBS domain-containing protein [candidate division NC10 bacterium]
MNLVSFTHLRNNPVIDSQGRSLGKVKDLAAWMWGTFPQVTKLLVARPGKEDLLVPWEQVVPLPEGGKGPVELRVPQEGVEPARIRGDEMLLGKNLLDKKVVDTKGRRAIRVNDLELEEVEGRLQLKAVEAGFRGILRHLGTEVYLERLASWLKLDLPRQAISWEFVEPIETELTRARRQAIFTKVAQLHPADIADIVEELNPSERAVVLESLDEETATEALTETEPEVQASVIQMMESEEAADILERMEPDEAADILHDLPEAKAQELLETMEREEAEEVEELLEHEEDTAGGLMTTEYVAMPSGVTASEAIQRIRAEASEAETIYYLYVVDEQERLIGVLSLRELILADPQQTLEEVMVRQVISVGIEAGLREVAETLSKYNLLALPVVDADGLLKGIVTIDDVIQLILPMIWKRRVPKKFV